MRCGICHATLMISGYRTKEYRDNSGRVYKTRRSPTFSPCPRLNDAKFHPARADGYQSGIASMKPLTERIAHAESMSARYLGNYNEEMEAGRTKGADKMLAKSQYWLDVANKLRGNGESTTRTGGR